MTRKLLFRKVRNVKEKPHLDEVLTYDSMNINRPETKPEMMEFIFVPKKCIGEFHHKLGLPKELSQLIRQQRAEKLRLQKIEARRKQRVKVARFKLLLNKIKSEKKKAYAKKREEFLKFDSRALTPHPSLYLFKFRKVGTTSTQSERFLSTREKLSRGAKKRRAQQRIPLSPKTCTGWDALEDVEFMDPQKCGYVEPATPSKINRTNLRLNRDVLQLDGPTLQVGSAQVELPPTVHFPPETQLGFFFDEVAALSKKTEFFVPYPAHHLQGVKLSTHSAELVVDLKKEIFNKETCLAFDFVLLSMSHPEEVRTIVTSVGIKKSPSFFFMDFRTRVTVSSSYKFVIKKLGCRDILVYYKGFDLPTFDNAPQHRPVPIVPEPIGYDLSGVFFDDVDGTREFFSPPSPTQDIHEPALSSLEVAKCANLADKIRATVDPVVDISGVENDVVFNASEILTPDLRQSFKVSTVGGFVFSERTTGTAFVHSSCIITANHVSKGAGFIDIGACKVAARGVNTRADVAWFGNSLPIFEDAKPGDICTVSCYDESFTVVCAGDSICCSKVFYSDLDEPAYGASGSPIVRNVDGALVGVYISGMKLQTNGKFKTVCYSPALSEDFKPIAEDIGLSLTKPGLYCITGPTGCGKTRDFVPSVVTSSILSSAKEGRQPKKVIVLQPTKALVEEQYEKSKNSGLPASYSHGDARNRINTTLHFTTTQRFVELYNNSTLNSNNVFAVLIDEAHYATEQYTVARELARRISSEIICCFMTATPGVLGKVEMSDKRTPYPITTKHVKLVSPEQDSKLITSIFHNSGKGRTWIRVPFSKSGKLLRTALLSEKKNKGLEIVFLDSEAVSTNKDIFSNILRGDYDIVISTDVISVGSTPGAIDNAIVYPQTFDADDSSGIQSVMLGRMSKTSFLQAIGRGGRVKPVTVYTTKDAGNGPEYTQNTNKLAAFSLVATFGDDYCETVNDWHSDLRDNYELALSYSQKNVKAAMSLDYPLDTALWMSEEGVVSASRFKQSRELNGVLAPIEQPLKGFVHNITVNKRGIVQPATAGEMSSGLCKTFVGPPVIPSGNIKFVENFIEKLGPYKTGFIGSTITSAGLAALLLFLLNSSYTPKSLVMDGKPREIQKTSNASSFGRLSGTITKRNQGARKLTLSKFEKGEGFRVLKPGNHQFRVFEDVTAAVSSCNNHMAQKVRVAAVTGYDPQLDIASHIKYPSGPDANSSPVRMARKKRKVLRVGNCEKCEMQVNDSIITLVPSASKCSDQPCFGGFATNLFNRNRRNQPSQRREQTSTFSSDSANSSSDSASSTSSSSHEPEVNQEESDQEDLYESPIDQELSAEDSSPKISLSGVFNTLHKLRLSEVGDSTVFSAAASCFLAKVLGRTNSIAALGIIGALTASDFDFVKKLIKMEEKTANTLRSLSIGALFGSALSGLEIPAISTTKVGESSSIPIYIVAGVSILSSWLSATSDHGSSFFPKIGRKLSIALNLSPMRTSGSSLVSSALTNYFLYGRQLILPVVTRTVLPRLLRFVLPKRMRESLLPVCLSVLVGNLATDFIIDNANDIGDVILGLVFEESSALDGKLSPLFKAARLASCSLDGSLFNCSSLMRDLVVSSKLTASSLAVVIGSLVINCSKNTPVQRFLSSFAKLTGSIVSETASASLPTRCSLQESLAECTILFEDGKCFLKNVVIDKFGRLLDLVIFCKNNVFDFPEETLLSFEGLKPLQLVSKIANFCRAGVQLSMGKLSKSDNTLPIPQSYINSSHSKTVLCEENPHRIHSFHPLITSIIKHSYSSCYFAILAVAEASGVTSVSVFLARIMSKAITCDNQIQKSSDDELLEGNYNKWKSVYVLKSLIEQYKTTRNGDELFSFLSSINVQEFVSSHIAHLSDDEYVFLKKYRRQVQLGDLDISSWINPETLAGKLLTMSARLTFFFSFPMKGSILWISLCAASVVSIFTSYGLTNRLQRFDKETALSIVLIRSFLESVFFYRAMSRGSSSHEFAQFLMLVVYTRLVFPPSIQRVSRTAPATSQTNSENIAGVTPARCSTPFSLNSSLPSPGILDSVKAFIENSREKVTTLLAAQANLRRVVKEAASSFEFTELFNRLLVIPLSIVRVTGGIFGLKAYSVFTLIVSTISGNSMYFSSEMSRYTESLKDVFLELPCDKWHFLRQFSSATKNAERSFDNLSCTDYHQVTSEMVQNLSFYVPCSLFVLNRFKIGEVPSRCEFPALRHLLAASWALGLTLCDIAAYFGFFYGEGLTPYSSFGWILSSAFGNPLKCSVPQKLIGLNYRGFENLEGINSETNEVHKTSAVVKGFTWLRATVRDLCSMTHLANTFVSHTLAPAIATRIVKMMVSKTSISNAWLLNCLMSSLHSILTTAALESSYLDYINTDSGQRGLSSWPRYGLNSKVEVIDRYEGDLMVVAPILITSDPMATFTFLCTWLLTSSLEKSERSAILVSQAEGSGFYKAVVLTVAALTNYMQIPLVRSRETSDICLAVALCSGKTNFFKLTRDGKKRPLQVLKTAPTLRKIPDVTRALEIAVLEKPDVGLPYSPLPASVTHWQYLKYLEVNLSRVKVVGSGRGGVSYVLSKLGTTETKLSTLHGTVSTFSDHNVLLGVDVSVLPVTIVDTGIYDKPINDVRNLLSEIHLNVAYSTVVTRVPLCGALISLVIEAMGGGLVYCLPERYNSVDHCALIVSDSVQDCSSVDIYTAVDYYTRSTPVPDKSKPIEVDYATSPVDSNFCQRKWRNQTKNLPLWLYEEFENGCITTYKPKKPHRFFSYYQEFPNLRILARSLDPVCGRKAYTSMYGITEFNALVGVTGLKPPIPYRVPDLNEGFTDGIIKRMSVDANLPSSQMLSIMRLVAHYIADTFAPGFVIRPLTRDELESKVNNRSGSGFTSGFSGLMGKYKSTNKFHLAVTSFIDDILKGNPVDELYYGIPKPEKLPPKKKTRTVVAAPAEHRAADMKMESMINDFFSSSKRHPASSSENIFKLSNRIGSSWKKFDRAGSVSAISRETPGWDARVSAVFQIYAGYQVLKILEKADTDPSVIKYYKRRTKQRVTFLIFGSDGNVYDRPASSQISGGIDTSRNNKINCYSTTIAAVSLALDKDPYEVLQWPNFNEGDNNVIIIPYSMTDEQWSKGVAELEHSNLIPDGEGRLVHRRLQDVPFCSQYVVEVRNLGCEFFVLMRDWNIISEKYARSVAHYSDNVSNFSLARAYTATLSLMASYWFLPPVRKIFDTVTAIIDPSIVKRIPTEFQAKLAIRFQVETIDDLNVSNVLRRAGYDISLEKIYKSNLDQDVCKRFNVPDVIDSEGLIDNIKAMILLLEDDRISGVPDCSVWSHTDPGSGVLWYSPNINTVEQERVVRTSYRPILSSLTRSIHFSSCSTHVIDLSSDLDRYDEVFNILTRSNANWTINRNTIVVSESKVLMSRHVGGEVVINVVPSLLSAQLTKAPWVPLWFKSYRGQLPVDILPSRRYPYNSAKGSYVIKTSQGCEAYWPLVGQETTFGGAKWVSEDTNRGYWSVGQSARSASAAWFSSRNEGNMKLYLSDSIDKTDKGEAALSVLTGTTYPMITVVEHVTGGSLIRSHKYWCAKPNRKTPVRIVVRFSTNGPGSTPATSPRARLICLLRLNEVDAGIYRPDKYTRLDGSRPIDKWSNWLPLYKPGLSHKAYTSQDCLILSDGFGSPYELFPALVAHRKVVLFSDYHQYCERFMVHSVHYFKCPLKFATSQHVKSALEWLKLPLDKNAVDLVVNVVKERVLKGEYVLFDHNNS